MLPEATYDLVVIGGGIGGYVAAVRAAQLGWRVAVVERAELGGTCLHRGCIPSKSLLRTAELLVQARSAAAFGVDHSAPVLNLTRAHERKDKTIQQLHQGVQGLLKRHGIEIIRGSGRVLGPSIFSPQAGAVAVELANGDRIMLAPRFTLLATGAAPRSLPGWTFDGKYVLSSDHALNQTELPQSAVIVGGGAIGVEWASLWSDFGVQVTLVEAQAQILPQEDYEVAEEVARALRQRGVRILTQCTVLTESLSVDGGVAFSVKSGGTQTDLRADVVLVAVGRAPVTDGLGLEATEIRLNSDGAIVVDEHYRTAEPSVFAVGDVIGGLQLAHVAAHEALHAVEVMAGRTPRPLDYTAMPRCTYSRPEVASTGLTEAQARARGLDVRVGKFFFRANGKAVLMGEPEGFVKVVADAQTDDVLGVHMVGPRVTDLISEAVLARVLNATPWEVAHAVHPHPTLAEVFGEAAGAVDGQALHG